MGLKKRPVVIHRAILGSLDRFIAFLLEETKGVLKTWLAPVQVNILPVSNEHHLDYANKVLKLLSDNDIRAEIDLRDEKLGYRLRESVTKKIPFTLVIGDKECENNTVTYRKYQKEEQIELLVNDFIDMIKYEIKNKE